MIQYFLEIEFCTWSSLFFCPQALREIDELLKYLDKAENEINTAEPVSTDPETLAVQLRDHRTFHADLEGKRAAVSATIDKCNRMLRETTNSEADDIKNKLDTIRNQVQCSS